MILLPAALLLASFAPWLIAPLLMLGGAYLCFEGAEKVWHWLNPADHHAEDLYKEKLADVHLEEKKVSGAIKTDFILSAEIMTITLSALPDLNIWMTAGALAVAGIIITVAVYGAVALIVKADDVGLHMAAEDRPAAIRALGRGIVRGMPGFMRLLVIVGTAAMLWVGGSIIVHGLEEMGVSEPGHTIHEIAVAAAHAVPSMEGFVEWFVTAFIDGVLGLILGLALIPVSKTVIAPVMGLFSRDEH